MFAEKFEEDFEMAVIKIQQFVKVDYKEASLLGSCIAHAYFEVEGDAVELANKFDLRQYELAALTKNKNLYQKKCADYEEHWCASNHAE
jgi:hypothetical protein